jgi:hypothetical protein
VSHILCPVDCVTVCLMDCVLYCVSHGLCDCVAHGLSHILCHVDVVMIRAKESSKLCLSVLRYLSSITPTGCCKHAVYLC